MTPLQPNLPSTRPSRIIDLKGQVFGRLTALYIEDRVRKGIRWMCQCSCGNKKAIYGVSLRSGMTKSCGCFRVEFARSMFQIHGHTAGNKVSPEFGCWRGMLNRCDPKSSDWKHYGGRGILVCDRWKESFQNFFDDMGQRPSSFYSIERIDNDGNYEPGNCKWATKKEQALNRRPRSICWHGHALTEDNIVGRRRRCKICRDLQAEKYKLKRIAKRLTLEVNQ